MKKLVRLLVVTGIVSLAGWSSAQAFPSICPSYIPSCGITGKACTQAGVCCITGMGYFACPCVNGHYQCNF
jgi:hypothetical protein